MSDKVIEWYIYIMQTVEMVLLLTGSGKLKHSRLKVGLALSCWVFIVVIPMRTVLDGPAVITVLRGVLSVGGMMVILWRTVDDTRLRRAILCISLPLELTATSLLAQLLVWLNCGLPIAEWGALEGLLARLLALVNLMWGGNLFLCFYRPMEKRIRLELIVMLTLLTVAQNVLMLGLGRYGAEILADHFLVCSAPAVFLSVAAQYFIYRVFTTTAEAMESRRELEQLRLRQELDYRYYQLARTSAAQLSTFRHDFRNQLQVAYAVAQQDPARAAGLLGALEERLEQTHRVRYCDNPIVDAVLSIKSDEARQAGFSTDIQAAVGEWALAEPDLASLFSNLLDNAIAGSQASGRTGEAITVRAGERQGFYVIRVENPCTPEAGKDSAPPREGHGLGLGILREIARRYHGSFQTRTEEGRFVALLTLEPADSR